METIQKKEITKSKYKMIVWGTLVIGLLLNSVISYYLIKQNVNTTLLGMYTLTGLIAGFGIGFAWSHAYNIKEETK